MNNKNIFRVNPVERRKELGLTQQQLVNNEIRTASAEKCGVCLLIFQISRPFFMAARIAFLLFLFLFLQKVLPIICN